jgi:hypothetical protein
MADGHVCVRTYTEILIYIELCCMLQRNEAMWTNLKAETCVPLRDNVHTGHEVPMHASQELYV